MNGRRQWSLQAVEPLLAGGRAPGSWRRQLSLATRRLDSLWLVCSWVEAWGADVPQINDSSLLGGCLDELASAHAPMNVAADEEARSRPAPNAGFRGRSASKAAGRKGYPEHTMVESERRPASRRRKRELEPPISPFVVPSGSDDNLNGQHDPDRAPAKLSQAAPRQPRSFTTVTTLPPRATVELLGRCADDPADRRAAMTDLRPRRSAPDRPEPVAAMPPKSLPVRWPEGPADQRQSVADRITMRIARRMRQSGSPTALQIGGSHDQTRLQLQWSMPIAVAQVTPELLERFAVRSGMDGVYSRVGDSTGQSAALRSANATSARHAQRAMSDRNGPQQSRPLSNSSSAVALNEADNTPAPATPAREAIETMDRMITTESSLTIAPEVPPMLPPPAVGVSILPIAGVAARHGAQAEESMAEEDLDVLAAKIKLILDEQARRHGIDV